jgi:hypothetical protein
MNPFSARRSWGRHRRRGRHGWSDSSFGLGLLFNGRGVEGLEARQLLAFTTDVNGGSVMADESVYVSAFEQVATPTVNATGLLSAAPAQVTVLGEDGLDAGVRAAWSAAVADVNARLAELPDRSDYPLIMNEVFGRAGTDVDAFVGRREQLATELRAGLGITVELRSESDLNGSRGAYAAAAPGGGERIYINADWVAGASADDVAAVLLEEIGHAIDQRLNPGLDSTGDEGEWFSDVVRGIQLSDEELTAIEAEDDSGLLSVAGQSVAVEMAASSVSITTTNTTLNNASGVLNFSVAIHNNTNTIDFLANVAIKAAVIKDQLVTQTRTTTRLNRNTQV